eukprot:5559294-Pyramimonas_sp.AAC.1
MLSFSTAQRKCRLLTSPAVNARTPYVPESSTTAPAVHFISSPVRGSPRSVTPDTQRSTSSAGASLSRQPPASAPARGAAAAPASRA